MRSESTVIQYNDEAPISLKYSDRLAISLGSSRFEASWKNQSMSWAALLSRLSKSKDTGETHAEYMSKTKDQQDQIKDIGGFVGGHLKGGKRKNGHVERRQILTLDLDFAPMDLWTEIQDNFDLDFAMCLHSTHKHSQKTARYRLVAPLDKPVSPDEYEAIARMIASKINIDYFDDTTFQPARLMYWPSRSTDVEPVFHYSDRPFINTEEVLAEYPDWTDASYWPESSRVKTERKRQADRQGDPLEKRGAIGAFCRTYTVTAAIEKFLSDVYAPTTREDRYTYLSGSTSGGLVVYGDDRWAFSNHGTDPCSGLLCNAFDLVRIHKYGSLDDDVKPGTPVLRMPSFNAMHDFVLEDSDTKLTLVREKKKDLEDDFAEVDTEKEPDDSWKTMLDISKSDGIKPTAANLYLIFENDPKLKGIRFNEIENCIEGPLSLPWTRANKYWSDTDDACLFMYLSHEYSLEAPDRVIVKAFTKCASEHRFNPIKSYIQGLPEWDGQPRVDTLFIDYLAADDTPYVRTVTRKTLVAAIARIMRPGCKYDTVTVLDGPPGIGKSTIFRTLASDDWFSDNLSLTDTRDKSAAEKLQGVWIMEIGEMQGNRKADMDILKGFISRQVDEYRPAYGRNLERHPRSCIICGTTNSTTGFLRDVTGNRRFWPVQVNGRGKLSVWDISPQVRDQIWAEALAFYLAGETQYLDADMEKVAERMQRAALLYDDREGEVIDYLEARLPANWYERTVNERIDFFHQKDELSPEETGEDMDREYVSAKEIWTECFNNRNTPMKRSDSNEIAQIMARIDGWTSTMKTKRIPGYGTQRVYERT